MAATIGVLVERGPKRSFAVAVDWPGWARGSSSTSDALDALESYRSRYAAVVAAESIKVPSSRLVVIETVRGDATTDFGVPSKPGDADRRSVRATDRTRFAKILTASWDAFDEAAATTGELRLGPRGGGRSVAKMVDHVAMAEQSYARKLGLRVAAEDRSDPNALRERILDVVTAATPPDRVGTWPLRYAVRRIAWHVLDHLFEMQDRAIS